MECQNKRTWYLVKKKDNSVVEASTDILDCVHRREEINTDSRITDKDPR